MTDDDLWSHPKARDALAESVTLSVSVESPEDHKAWIAQLAASDPVAVNLERPRCPKCGDGLEVYWQRQRKVFEVYHSRRDCELRWSTFGSGKTETEAWENVKTL